MLGDYITTSAYERNTKVIQSSYISKANEDRNVIHPMFGVMHVVKSQVREFHVSAFIPISNSRRESKCLSTPKSITMRFFHPVKRFT